MPNMSTSMVQRTRAQKLASLAGTLAIKLASDAKDPTYAKFKLARAKYVDAKTKIMAKYGRQAKMLAMKSTTAPVAAR